VEFLIVNVFDVPVLQKGAVLLLTKCIITRAVFKKKLSSACSCVCLTSACPLVVPLICIFICCLYYVQTSSSPPMPCSVTSVLVTLTSL